MATFILVRDSDSIVVGNNRVSLGGGVPAGHTEFNETFTFDPSWTEIEYTRVGVDSYTPGAVIDPGTEDDKRVSVSSNDTTSGFLLDKLVITAGKLVLTEVNDGGDEDLRIDPGADLFDKTVDDTDDITTGLTNKFWTGIGTTVPGGTNGSILYISSGNVAEDNPNLFYDDFNIRFGLGTASPEEMVHLLSTSAAPVIKTTYEDGTPAASDLISKFLAEGRNSAAADVEYGNFEFSIVDPTSTTEDGRLDINLVLAGALSNILRIAGDSIGISTDPVATVPLTLNAGIGGAGIVINSNSGSARFSLDLDAVNGDARIRLRDSTGTEQIKFDADPGGSNYIAQPLAKFALGSSTPISGRQFQIYESAVGSAMKVFGTVAGGSPEFELGSYNGAPAFGYELGTVTGDPLYFKTGNTKQTGLTSAGYFGVGVLAPTERIESSDGIKMGTAVSSAAGVMQWDGSDFEGHDGTAFRSFWAAKVTSNDTTPDFLFTKIVAGSGITVTELGDGGNETLEIAAPGSTTDEKVAVTANDTTPDFLFNKITATAGKIVLTEVNDGFDEDLNINIGADVFDKTVDDTDDIIEGLTNLFFTDERVDDRVAALVGSADSSITITYNDVANTLDFVVNEANVDHDALQNFVGNEHVDHTSVSVVAGGDDALAVTNNDLSANIGLTVDISGTTAETSIDAADLILIHDDSAGALRAMTRANFVAGLMTGLTIGDSIASSTVGSVLFVGSSNDLQEDNANFFWDETNLFLGLGTNTPSAPVHVLDAAGFDPIFLLECTDPGNQGPVFEMYHNSATPANNDTIARWVFNGEDSGGNKTTFARMLALVSDITDGAEDGELRFEVQDNGSFNTVLRLLRANPVVIIGGGDVRISNGIDIGAASFGTAGVLQWDGTDFEGHDGTAFRPLWGVKVTANDTTPDFLLNKVTAGFGIVLTEQNDGADEDLQIAFNQEFHYADSDALSTTASTTFIEKLKLTTASLAGGDYLISWCCEAKPNDGNNRTMELRVQVDDTTTINLPEPHGMVPADEDAPDGFWFTFSGFKRLNLTAAVHTVDIDFRSKGSTTDTMNIRNARIALWRVS